ncbi:MAG: fumarate hydratase [Lentisphaerae bacterium]|nr:fumarate hydratase [Lentisphaerota bacterium]
MSEKIKIKIASGSICDSIRTIPFAEVVEAVRLCCLSAAVNLPQDVLASLENAYKNETNALAKELIGQCLENARIAREENMPICQDTGFAVFFVEIGTHVKIDGGTICEAITEGTRQGYKDGFLRKSIVSDPLFKRKNTTDNTPPIIHLTQVPGDRINVILAPKGGGSENMSALKMLKPSDGRAGVVDFVVESVVKAGGNPCPPVIVGVGIGGTFEQSALLAKKALLRKVGSENPDREYAELEQEILSKINASGVGPQGLGGDTTALAVHINHHPCHIASLPVAVNINCHAARHAGFEL